MNIIIKRFIITILIVVGLAFLVRYSLKKDVYEINYDVYNFDPCSQKYFLNSEDNKIYINSYSKDDAIDEAIEFLYLNSLFISDSVVINSMNKL